MFITILAQLPIIITSIIIGVLLQSTNFLPMHEPEIVLICFLAAIIYLTTQNNYIRLGTTALLSLAIPVSKTTALRKIFQ